MAAPVLDLVLAIGDRVSRLAEPEDYEYYPIRPASERELPEALVTGDDRGGDDAGEVADDGDTDGDGVADPDGDSAQP